VRTLTGGALGPQHPTLLCSSLSIPIYLCLLFHLLRTCILLSFYPHPNLCSYRCCRGLLINSPAPVEVPRAGYTSVLLHYSTTAASRASLAACSCLAHITRPLIQSSCHTSSRKADPRVLPHLKTNPDGRIKSASPAAVAAIAYRGVAATGGYHPSSWTRKIPLPSAGSGGPAANCIRNPRRPIPPGH
jgi:hypothetical protein